MSDSKFLQQSKLSSRISIPTGLDPFDFAKRDRNKVRLRVAYSSQNATCSWFDYTSPADIVFYYFPILFVLSYSNMVLTLPFKEINFFNHWPFLFSFLCITHWLSCKNIHKMIFSGFCNCKIGKR